jgi:hypothetical protein
VARPSAERLALLRKMMAQKGIEKTEQTSTIKRRAQKGDAPLAGAQARLWFLDQFEPGTALYTDSLALTIEGIALDPELFQRAFTEVVRRHEVMRSSFHTGPEGPLQRLASMEELAASGVMQIKVHQLEGIPDADARLEAILLADVQQPFEFDKLPQWRGALVQISDKRWVFGLTMNHIISDGVSYGIIYKEVGDLYRAYGAGRPSPLEELPIQFSDFAQWEHDRTPESRILELLPFWQRYLGGELPALRWPGKAGTSKHVGAYYRFKFNDSLYRKLQDFCKREQVTSNWVLMAAYFVLLNSFAGQEDLRIGTPSSIRKHSELEPLVGFFVQTVVLRLNLADNPDFMQLLKLTRETALDVQKHEDVPFERVNQTIRPRGQSAAETPLIQAWIAPMKDLMDVMQLPGAESSYSIVDGKIARFDLALILDEARGGIQAFFEYDTALFDEQHIAQFEKQYSSILHQALEHPETKLRAFREMLVPSASGQPQVAAVKKKIKRTQRRSL